MLVVATGVLGFRIRNQEKTSFQDSWKNGGSIRSKDAIIMGSFCVKNMYLSNKFDDLNGCVLGR